MAMVFQAVQFYCCQRWYNNITRRVTFPLVSDWSGLGGSFVLVLKVSLWQEPQLLAPHKHSERFYLLPRSTRSQDTEWQNREHSPTGPEQFLSLRFICFTGSLFYFSKTTALKCFNGKCKSCVSGSLYFAGKCTSLHYSWSRPWTRKLLVGKVMRLSIKELSLQSKTAADKNDESLKHFPCPHSSPFGMLFLVAKKHTSVPCLRAAGGC